MDKNMLVLCISFSVLINFPRLCLSCCLSGATNPFSLKPTRGETPLRSTQACFPLTQPKTSRSAGRRVDIPSIQSGFRKIDPDTWEFANEAFVRGKRHVLKNIKRRRTPNAQALSPVNEIGKSSFDEVGHLKHEKQVLMMELVKLKQQQQTTRAQLQAMELRLQGTELKQQKMMNFLAKAMQNPDFVQKLVKHGKSKEFQEAIKNQIGESSQTGGGSKLIKSEPEEFMDSSSFQVSELEALALEIQGIGRSKRNQEHEHERNDLEFDGGEKELDDEFWEELFSDRSYEQSADDVNFLADKLDFLGSSPK